MKRKSLFSSVNKPLYIVTIFLVLCPAASLGQERDLRSLNITATLINPQADNSSVALAGREIKLTTLKMMWREGDSIQKLLTTNHVYADGESVGILYMLNPYLDSKSLIAGEEIVLLSVNNPEEFSREFDKGCLVLLALDDGLKKQLCSVSKDLSAFTAQTSGLNAQQFESPGEKDDFVRGVKSIIETMDTFAVVIQERARPLSSDMLGQMLNELEQAKAIIQNTIIGKKRLGRLDTQTFALIEKNMTRRQKILNEEKGIGEWPALVKTTEGPSWNVWVEESPDPTPTPDGKPVPYLIKGCTYQLFLDLAAISYGKNEQGAYTLPASPTFRELLNDWLEKYKNSKDKKIELTTVLLADPVYFETDQTVNTINLSLRKIQNLINAGEIKIDHDPFEIMAQEKDPDFVYGHVGFRIAVKPDVPEGPASLSLSLWVNNRPVEEIAVRLCIAPNSSLPSVCKGIGHSQYGLRGVDSLRIALEDAPFPDASLHFVELARGKVLGVFRRNDSTREKFVTWPLGIGLEGTSGLRTLLENQISALVRSRDNETELRKKGEGLYNILFPDTQPAARSAFEGFIKDHLHQSPPKEGLERNAKKDTVAYRRSASIFVRLIQQDNDQPPLIPLGLIAVRLDSNEPEFLGFHFRIEAPLQIQSYQALNKCLSRWVTVIPGSQVNDVELNDSMAQLANSGWMDYAERPFTKMRQFEDWIGERVIEKEPAAILILSHHDKNTIYFDENSTELVTSSHLVRKFRKPSIAILNGCGTANPGGGADFVRRFNLNGVDAIIATSSQVNPRMAGDFLASLEKILKDNKNNKELSISEVYFQALQALRSKVPTDGSREYGPRVLEYTLLGNGNIGLCLPDK